MYLWVFLLCASLILITSHLSFQQAHKPERQERGMIPADAVRLYHTQRYWRDLFIFGAKKVIYATTPVKNNPLTLLIYK